MNTTQNLVWIKILLASLLLLNGEGIPEAHAGFCVAHDFGNYHPDKKFQVWGTSHQEAGDAFCKKYAAERGYACGDTPVYFPIGCGGTGTCKRSHEANLGCHNFTLTYFSCASQGDALPFDSFDRGCGCSDPRFEAVNDPENGLVGCVSMDLPNKNTGCAGELGTGNPCNVATGNKYQVETDFVVAGVNFVRYYNSLNVVQLGLGKGWQHNHLPRLIVMGDSLIRASRDGRGEDWIKVNGIWKGDADTGILIVENDSGFQLTLDQGDIENYDANGMLLTAISTQGEQTHYHYDDNRLSTVTDHYGQVIQLGYEQQKLIAVTDPLGHVYRYRYDANDNLSEVVYPDATPNDDSDNPRKTYHYENPEFPNHLTGISDENGDRYATYTYDAEGRAISTEHAQTTNDVGQEKFELDFQGAQ